MAVRTVYCLVAQRYKEQLAQKTNRLFFVTQVLLDEFMFNALGVLWQRVIQVRDSGG